MCMWRLVIILALIWPSQQVELLLGVLLDITDFRFPECCSHVKYAMKHINDLKFLGENITLDFEIRNADSAGAALQGAIELCEMDDLVGIIGTTSGITSETAAQYATIKETPMMSSEASSPELVSKVDMTYFFRAVGSDNEPIKLVAATARHYDWRRLSAVAPDNSVGYARTELLRTELTNVGVVLSSTIYYAMDTGDNVDTDSLYIMAQSVALGGAKVTLLMGTKGHRLYIVQELLKYEWPDHTFLQLDEPWDTFENGDPGLYAYQEGWLYFAADEDDEAVTTTTTTNESAYEGDALWERYITRWSTETTRYNCTRDAGKDIWANLRADPTIYDFTVISSYPQAARPVFGPFPCANGDGGAASPETANFFFRGFYDSVWIFAHALKRILDASSQRTTSDLVQRGDWIRRSLLNTSFVGLRQSYEFDKTTQDVVRQVAVYNLVKKANSTGEFDVVKVFEPTSVFYSADATCDIDPGGAECVAAVTNTSVVWPPAQKRDVALDGRHVSAESCVYAETREVYRVLGNGSVTINLFSHFNEQPELGTIFDVSLRDNSSGEPVWAGSYEVPALQDSVVVPFEIPAWGDFELEITDHFTNILVEDKTVSITATQPDCDPGKIWDDDTGECVTCPLGSEENSGACTPLGYSRDQTSYIACILCPESSYADSRGRTNCTDCPLNSQRYDYDFAEALAGSVDSDTIAALIGTDRSQCLCKPHYYSTSGSRADAKNDEVAWGNAGARCAPCARGATCQGKTYPPKNKEDYWGDPRAKNPVEFKRCSPFRCKADFECYEPYRGRLCSMLKTREYFAIGGAHPPLRCPQYHGLNIFLFSLLFFAVFTTWIYVNLFFGHKSLSIFFTHVQLIAIIAHFHVDYPEVTNNYLSVLYNFVLFDADIVSPSCLTSWTKLSTFQMTIAIPFFGLFFFIPVGVKVVGRLATDPYFRTNFSLRRLVFDYYETDYGKEVAYATSLALSLLDAMFPNLALHCMNMLRCDRYETVGHSYSRMDPTLRCGTSKHKLAQAIAVIGLFAVLSWPVALAHCIHRAYKRSSGVHEHHMLARLGWAYDKLASPHHMAAVLPHVQTMAVCIIAVVFQDGHLQLFLMTYVSLSAFAYVALAKPYAQERYNKLAIHSELTVLLYTGISVIVGKRSSFDRTWTAVVIIELTALLFCSIQIAKAERNESTARGKGQRAIRARLKLKRRAMGFSFTTSIGHLVAKWHLPPPSGSSARTHVVAAAAAAAASGDGESTPPKSPSSPSSSRGPNSPTRCRLLDGEALINNNSNDVSKDPLVDQMSFNDSSAGLSILRRGKADDPAKSMSDALSQLARSVDADTWAALSDEDLDVDQCNLIRGVVRSLKSVVDDASPLSVFSADHKSRFWRSLAETFPGIIAFAADVLSHDERFNMFGILVKLQNFLASKRSTTPWLADDVIEGPMRSSILYSLLCEASQEDRSIARFLELLVLCSKKKAVGRQSGLLAPVYVGRRMLGSVFSARASDKRVRPLTTTTTTTKKTTTSSNSEEEEEEEAMSEARREQRMVRKSLAAREQAAIVYLARLHGPAATKKKEPPTEPPADTIRSHSEGQQSATGETLNSVEEPVTMVFDVPESADDLLCERRNQHS
ncbi:hypothetical protein CTAYLR_002398 [Chrysophaeum taylorii]|uniref:Receptor ligand binding region domain-containing protein n=1 Tax=Chrysophaeum taylorii TaxID=2483200 RepID=A0AAD7XM05_9STRA|nr:hypothetical protein CTAYLR_002398 [Chrysophaeum taylorii]